MTGYMKGKPPTIDDLGEAMKQPNPLDAVGELLFEAFHGRKRTPEEQAARDKEWAELRRRHCHTL